MIQCLKILEKMAKEMVCQKSAMISVALENYKKGQENKKAVWQALAKQNILGKL